MQVQIVASKKFVIVALNADSKTFVVHVAIQKLKKMIIYLDQKAQIATQDQSIAQSGAQNGV